MRAPVCSPIVGTPSMGFQFLPINSAQSLDSGRQARLSVTCAALSVTQVHLPLEYGGILRCPAWEV